MSDGCDKIYLFTADLTRTNYVLFVLILRLKSFARFIRSMFSVSVPFILSVRHNNYRVMAYIKFLLDALLKLL